MTKATIPITDHNTGSPMICTQHYLVKYRLTGTPTWNVLVPYPYTGTVVIEGLSNDTTYDYSIQRVCCNGSISAAATGTFLTSP